MGTAFFINKQAHFGKNEKKKKKPPAMQRVSLQ